MSDFVRFSILGNFEGALRRDSNSASGDSGSKQRRQDVGCKIDFKHFVCLYVRQLKNSLSYVTRFGTTLRHAVTFGAERSEVVIARLEVG